MLQSVITPHKKAFNHISLSVCVSFNSMLCHYHVVITTVFIIIRAFSHFSADLVHHCLFVLYMLLVDLLHTTDIQTIGSGITRHIMGLVVNSYSETLN